jgi:flagellar assembly protein FliH
MMEFPAVDPSEAARAMALLREMISRVGDMAPIVDELNRAVHANARQQGYSDGIERAQHEMQQQIVEAIAVLTSAQAERHRLAEEHAPALAELAMQIARRVIGAQLDQDPALVRRIVEARIAELEPTTSLTVRVHPDEAASIEEDLPTLERMVKGPGSVAIVPDDTVDRGGCVLVTPVGEVDARVETRLGVLDAAFAAQRRQPTSSGPTQP